MSQISLFEPNKPEPIVWTPPEPKREKLGQVSIAYKNASSIVTKASGFMDSYDFTLNPYSGCSFGCTYCYAAFFARDKEKQQNWGHWVEVKQNAVAQLQRKKVSTLQDKVIYMSSVTDPYQPIEKELELIPSLLQVLITKYNPITLYVQTRSPLVTRDIDLYQELDEDGDVQINMTVTTDDETVRRVFEPYCPSNARRLEAIQKIQAAGIDACITMTPLLPVKNVDTFAQQLRDTGVKKFIIQPFHAKRGRFVAGTRGAALEKLNETGWGDDQYTDKYAETLEIIKTYIPDIGEGKDGFRARKKERGDDTGREG